VTTPDQRARDLILQSLRDYSREPAREVAASAIAGRPKTKDWRALARRHPDRWSQGYAVVMRQAGYTEKTQVDVNLSVQIQSMSDAELQAYHRDLETRIQALERKRRPLPVGSADLTLPASDPNSA
jgi:hypothetical protein